MSGSRRFLLLLVLACVTCVVLVQVSMDGKNIGFFPPYRDSESEKENGSQNFKLTNIKQVVTKSTKIIHQPTSRSTAKIHVTKSTPEILKSHRESVSSPPLKNTTQPSVGKGRVITIPFGRSLSQQQPKMLVSRQERLRELLKQSSVMQRRPALENIHSLLRSIPYADPDKVTKIFIITYFRAGSSFFGDILQQNWKTFYHFEPLHSMTYDKRIDDDKIPEVFRLFNNIFSCNFTEAKEYLDWVKQPRNQFLFAHNIFLWVTCHSNPKACFNASFVNEVCRRAPVHVMKLTRLHMRHLRSYLQDNTDMNAKVIYLTRDPRGIVSSRWSLDWCNGTNCSDPGVLCREMDEDIAIFNELRNYQPQNFIKVRYEDLSLNTVNETEKLFEFLHLPFSPSVRKFLKTHTVGRRNDDKNPYSTRRNSTSMAFSWRERFTYKQILDVQSQCRDTLNKLNHSLILSPNELPFPNGKPIPKIVTKAANYSGKKKVTNLRKGVAMLIKKKQQYIERNV